MNDEPGTVAHGPLDRDPLTTRPSVSRVVEAPADAVWRVLTDGWAYATWVVGASRVRQVDRDWPGVGSRIHHSVGLWPLLLSDTTEVEVHEPERRLLLHARGRPLGEARVLIEIEPDGQSCEVRIREDASSGPGRLVPVFLRQAIVLQRNKEALRRLALLAERRDESGTPTVDAG